MAQETTGQRWLRAAALVFAAGFVLHNADHVRRGFDALTAHVLVAGSLGGLLTLGAIGLVLARHPLAPLAAVAVGYQMAVGVAAVHLLPRWSAFSDSLPDGPVDGWTWVAVLAEIAGALAFGLAGSYALRRDGWPEVRFGRSGRSVPAGTP
jgi:hypothetical protein